MRVALISFSLLSCSLFADAARPDDRDVLALQPSQEASYVEMVSSGHMISKEMPVPDAEANAEKPQFDIAKEGGELKKLPKLYEDMKDKFKNAADKVWTGGDEKKADNFIQKTGLDWMNSVQTFRHTAGEMRKHAEDVYDDIVKSHTVAAKKQMRTFKEEMAKLKKVHEENGRMADEAKNVDTSAHTSGAHETTAGTGEAATESRKSQPINSGAQETNAGTGEATSEAGRKPTYAEVVKNGHQ